MADIQVRLEAVITNDEGKILLAQHERDDRRYWVLPGGKLELFENMEDGILRELREELDINQASVTQLLFLDEFISKEEDRHIVKAGFKVEVQSDETTFSVVTKDESIKDVFFLSESDIRESSDTFFPSKDFYFDLFSIIS